MSKISIVGVEGSGKTTLMAAFGEKYERPDENGYVLKAANATTFRLVKTLTVCMRQGRMPTAAEIESLVKNCDTEWTMRNGVAGRLVKGRGAYSSRSIFLPATHRGYDFYLDSYGSLGRYWSSTPVSGDSDIAWYLNFDSGDFDFDGCSRNCGWSVRPVRGFA